MPEDAARRFAVVGVVESLYNENIIIWQITLHAITKETAQEAETSGLPVGEGSDYDTYTESMDKEDYERMASSIDIDAERERITEVQNCIIWLAYCCHGVEVVLKSGKAEEKQRKELFDAGMMLAEEQKERIDEEAELRRALEAAGVQVFTTEGRAKEQLEAIHARRAEIAEADQKTRVFEDLDGEDEIPAADELELSIYLDAVAKAEHESPADSEDGLESTDNTDNTDNTEDPPEEDEEDRVISVITKGLCPYCGQVVEVGSCTS